MRLNRNQLVTIWSVGIVCAVLMFIRFRGFETIQGFYTAKVFFYSIIVPVLIVGVCFFVTFSQKKGD